jgi:hypothetical protein
MTGPQGPPGSGSGGSPDLSANTINDNTFNFHPYSAGPQGECNIGFGIVDAKKNPAQPDTIVNAIAKIDDWMWKYVIGPPPAPTQVALDVSATTTELKIAFDNFPQINAGAFKRPVPYMLNASIDVSGTNFPYTKILDHNTIYIPEISENRITGLILSRNNGTSGYFSRTFDTSGALPAKRPAYVYFNTDFSGIELPITTNIWYENYFTCYQNKLTVALPDFLTGYPPSAPLDLSLNLVPANRRELFDSSWNIPQFADAINLITPGEEGAPNITYGYYYSPKSTPRYGGIYNPTPYTGTTINTYVYDNSATPGTVYIYDVSATNTTTTQYGPSASGEILTAYPNMPATLDTIPYSFPTDYTYFAAKKVSDNTSLTEPIIYSGEDHSSNLISSIPVQWWNGTIALPGPSVGNPGSTASDIMDISATTTNGTNTYTSADILFGGFDTSPEYKITGDTTMISFLYDSATDPYSGSYSGFYKNVALRVQLNTPALTPSSDIYTMSLSQYFPNYGRKTRTTTYYVDDLSQAAQIQSQTFDFVSDRFVQVSGVYVLGGNPQPDISYQIVARNLGRYFYPTNRLLNVFSNPGGVSVLDTDITNLTTSDNTGQVPMKSPITFTAATPVGLNIVDSLTGIYATSLPLRTTPYNISAAGTQDTSSVPVIIDAPSVRLIKTDLAQTIPTAGQAGPYNVANFVKGQRVGTGATDPAKPTLRVPVISSGPYSEWALYDNSQSLANSSSSPYVYEDLQVCNGAFRTRVNASTYGYFDYQPYLRAPGRVYNPYDYSSLTSETKYRFATFRWKVAATSVSTTYAQLYFKIESPSTLYYNSNIDYNLYTDSGRTKQVRFFYRFENQNTTGTDSRIPNNGTEGPPNTSVWVDLTSVNLVLNFNTYMRQYTSNGLLGGSTTFLDPPVRFDTVNHVFRGVMPSITPNDQSPLAEIYVYVRIGVPMDADFKMTGISCQIIP